MPARNYTRIVITRSDGRTEVVGRPGHHDADAVARTFASHGTVVAVRHETMPEGGTEPETVAIRAMDQ